MVLLELPCSLEGFLKLGFSCAQQLVPTGGVGLELRVAKYSAELPELFKRWAAMPRVPKYEQMGSDGIRVDKVSNDCGKMLVDEPLPDYWLVLDREPTAIEACSFCCVWLTDLDPWVCTRNYSKWRETTGVVSIWTSERLTAYSQFVSSPALRTTSAVAELGIYVWRPLEILLEQVERVQPCKVASEFDKLMLALKKNDRKAAGYLLDSGKIFGARKKVHKQWHYFDLATVVACAATTWAKEDAEAAERFWIAVTKFLFDASTYRWRYQRVLFTFCQLFGDRYWPTKLQIYLEREMMSLDDQGWLVVCKQLTTFVSRSFCLPFTNRRGDASLSFMHLHSYALEQWFCDLDRENMSVIGDIYVGGSILGAPGGVIHSLMSATTGSRSEFKPTPSVELNFLATISEEASRAARRGMDGLFITHLYNDAEKFFRKVRERDCTNRELYEDHYLSKGAIRAPRQQGGYGILQPWVLFYDWGQASGRRPLSGQLSERADANMKITTSRSEFPGVIEWVNLSLDRSEKATGLVVSGKASSMSRLNNKFPNKADELSGDGSDKMQEQVLGRKMMGSIPTAPHKVKAIMPSVATRVAMHTEAQALFTRLEEALGIENLVCNASELLRGKEPHAAKGEMDAQFGGLGRQCLKAAGSLGKFKEDVIQAVLSGSMTRSAILGQSRSWPSDRAEQWVLNGWPDGFNTSAVPPIAVTLAKCLQDVYLTEWAGVDCSKREWLLRCVAASQAAIEAVMKYAPKLFLH